MSQISNWNINTIDLNDKCVSHTELTELKASGLNWLPIELYCHAVQSVSCGMNKPVWKQLSQLPYN